MTAETLPQNESRAGSPGLSRFIPSGNDLVPTSPRLLELNSVKLPSSDGDKQNRSRHLPPLQCLFYTVPCHGSPHPGYITKARLSNSCCRTGKEQPAISTRLAASRARWGDTPKPRPVRKTCISSAASRESTKPPCRRSFRKAVNSVAENVSLMYMAVITSDFDLELLSIRLISTCGRCMQFCCRAPSPCFLYVRESHLVLSTPSESRSCPKVGGFREPSGWHEGGVRRLTLRVVVG